MKNLQTALVVNHGVPISINNTSLPVTNQIDTRGRSGGELLVVVQFGSIAGSATLTACSLQESDVTGSGFADVTGCVLATSNLADGSGASVAFAGGDEDSSSIVFHVPLTESRKRFFQVVVTCGGGAAVLVSAVAIMTTGRTDANESLDTLATDGAHQQILIAS